MRSTYNKNGVEKEVVSTISNIEPLFVQICHLLSSSLGDRGVFWNDDIFTINREAENSEGGNKCVGL